MKAALDRLEGLLGEELVTYDPYDLWATALGVRLRSTYYRFGRIATPVIAPFYLLDLYAPKLIRLFLEPKEYPMVRAQAALAAVNLYELGQHEECLKTAKECVGWLIENQSTGFHGACWGLGIPWMTKTGYLPPTAPFVTNTPYCVEALLRIADLTQDSELLVIGQSSVGFLDSDLERVIDEPEHLALSYGPGHASRIVINANSYAMMMYAMLSSRIGEEKDRLLRKAIRLFNYIDSRQSSDGSWSYYDDEERGNFIDCFHSCFILKNLLKFGRYSGIDVSKQVQAGLDYVLENLLDGRHFLARRFSVSAHPSLVRYDLYDQAELLNVLCMTGRLALASKLHDSVMSTFYVRSLGCFGYQIDCFGRLNKMRYLRWAMMPMILAMSEYYKLLDGKAEAGL